MAQPAIPIFIPLDPAHVTGAEWTQYENDVITFETWVTNQVHTLDHTAQTTAAPAAFINAPTSSTGRLLAAGRTTAWLYGLDQQRVHLEGIAAAALHAAALAAATAGGGAPPNPNQPPAWLATLLAALPQAQQAPPVQNVQFQMP